MLKKIRTGLPGIGAVLCAAAYIAGMTPYGRASDVLLITALACMISGDIFFILLPPNENEIRNRKQLMVLQLLFAVLAASYLSYHRTAALKQPVSLAVAGLSVLWFLCGLTGLLRGMAARPAKRKREAGACRGAVWEQGERGKDIGAVGMICGVFLLFSCSEIISISQWDSTFYLNSLDQFVEKYDLTFQTLLSGNMGGHLSIGYSLAAVSFHMLWMRGNIGVKIFNILLGWGAIFCFFQILRRLGVNRGFAFASALLFAVSPLFLGTIGFISVDYAMLVYFLFFLYSYLHEKNIFMVLSGFLFLFTKETAIVIYAFFWLGVFFYRAFTLEKTEKVRWRELFSVLLKSEWAAVCIPVVLFLSTFVIYAMENIGWPGKTAGGKLSWKLFSALVLLAVFVLTAVKIWINLWFLVRRSGLSPHRKKMCGAMVLLLPVLAGLTGTIVLWQVKPWVLRRLLIHGPKDINRIGIGKDHIIAILKQAYVLHFSWILLLMAAAGAVFFLKDWKEHSKKETEFIIAAVCADMGLVLFTMGYVTYQNPRYLQLHYALLALISLFLWYHVWKEKQRRIGIGAAGLVAALLLCETYCYADPLTRRAFYNRDIGNGVLCAGSNEKFSGVSSSYSDRAVNSRVYTYYFKNLEKFLKEIDYDGSQILLFPENNDWVVLGRKNLETMDTELKCIVSYEGSIADSVVHLRNAEEAAAYWSGGREVYYVDTGATHAKVDKFMQAHYSGKLYKIFTTGAWETRIYKL